MREIARAWNRFFFTPTSPLTLGVFRFFYGLVVFVAVLGVYPHRATFYGTDAIVLPLVMDKFFAGRWMILGFSFLPVTEPGLGYFLLGLLGAAAMLSLGLFTRVASVAVAVGLVSLHNRNFFITNAGDLLMRINSLILIFADSGAALSLDRWYRARRGKEGPEPRLISAWPVRLMQLQLSYVYLTTAALKTQGASWRDGTALYYALRYLELRRFSFRYLFYYLWQVKLATWGTMVAEALMGSLVWLRKLRYPILFAALCLHEGINLTMQFPVFQYVMMVNLILFVYPEDVKKLMSRFGFESGRGNGQSGKMHEERNSAIPPDRRVLRAGGMAMK